jgi:hypothetical protein
MDLASTMHSGYERSRLPPVINASLGRNYCYAQGGFASKSEAELGLNHSTPEIFVIHLVRTVGDVEEPWSD